MPTPKQSTPDISGFFDTPKAPTPKQQTPKVPTPKQPTPRVPTPKQSTPDISGFFDTPKGPTPRQPTPKVPTPRQPTPRVPTPKQSTPDISGFFDTPKQPTPRVPTPRQPTPQMINKTLSPVINPIEMDILTAPPLPDTKSSIIIRPPSTPSPKNPVKVSDLPYGWEIFKDDATGVNYYYSKVDGVSTWEKPIKDKLPYGWEVVIDKDSKTRYFHSRIDGLSVWEEPVKSKLPDGWVVYVDENTGRAYFYSTITGVSSWAVPIENRIPYDWQAYMDPKTGYPYFYSRIEKMSTWERPTKDVKSGLYGVVKSKDLISKMTKKVLAKRSMLPVEEGVVKVTKTGEILKRGSYVRISDGKKTIIKIFGIKYDKSGIPIGILYKHLVGKDIHTLDAVKDQDTINKLENIPEMAL